MRARFWYLIHTKPRQERTALLNLERQAYTVYLPLHRQRRRYRCQYRLVVEPLFPRYLFIFLDSQLDNWSPIRSTRGVANLVRFGGQPARVPDVMIHDIRAQEAKLLKEGFVEERFEKGDSIEIIDGVMANYEGVFQEKIGSKRAAILLRIADHYTTVQVPIRSLEKCE